MHKLKPYDMIKQSDKLEFVKVFAMDDKKKISIAVVIINCICAVVWNINLFVDLAYGYTNSVSFALHIICAIVWDICAVVWILRYRKSKKDNE